MDWRRLLGCSVVVVALAACVPVDSPPDPPPPAPAPEHQHPDPVPGPTTDDVLPAPIAPLPTPAGPAPTGKAEFVANCSFSHRLADDPIVVPHQSGGSHLHDFFGSRATSAHTTTAASLGTATTCDVAADASAYWVPTVLVNGTAVAPDRATFYYASDHADPRTIVPFPVGFRMIAGNAKATTPNPAQGPRPYTWSCQGAGGGGADFPTCPAGHPLEILLFFPSCWTGTALDSADHKSHVAFPVAGKCPSTHPVQIPRVEFKLRYPTLGGPGTVLSSGSSWTAHGDFFNNWVPAEQERRVVDCLRAGRKCNPAGQPT